MLFRNSLLSFSVFLYLVAAVSKNNNTNPQERLAMLVEKYNLRVVETGEAQVSGTISHDFLDSLEAALKALYAGKEQTVDVLQVMQLKSAGKVEPEGSASFAVQEHGSARIKDCCYSPGGWIIHFDYSYEKTLGRKYGFEVQNITSRRFGLIFFGRWMAEGSRWHVSDDGKLWIQVRGYLSFGFKGLSIDTDSYTLNVLWNPDTNNYEGWWD